MTHYVARIEPDAFSWNSLNRGRWRQKAGDVIGTADAPRPVVNDRGNMDEDCPVSLGPDLRAATRLPDAGLRTYGSPSWRIVTGPKA